MAPYLRSLRLLATIGIVALGLVGCGDVNPPYSDLVNYGVRTDPLILTDKLGADEAKLGERYEPDRPGQLPLMFVKDLLDTSHPLYRIRKDQATGSERLFTKQDWEKDNLLRDPMDASKDDRRELEAWLTGVFGTPAHPTVDGISPEQRDALKLDVRTLERGSILYRVHCLHCHGVAGDGRGPTARWVHPHPRDYRQGLFKFQAVDQTTSLGRPPRRADLHRIIKNGAEGTAMPSFALIGDAEIDLLVSYVIHLSIRGQVEYETFKSGFTFDEAENELVLSRPIEKSVAVMTRKIADNWSALQPDEIKLAPYKDGDKKALRESVQRGQQLFLGIGVEGKKANCVNCHTDYGRQAKYRFDSWGTLVRPNNLTQGVYRGGRRTVDIYQRIHSGINGSGMLAFGKDLKPDSIWDLVNFVQTLPYPAMRRDLGINID